MRRHRSRRRRTLVLLPAVLMSAACTRRDDASDASDPLERDRTLSAQLELERARPADAADALPASCAVGPTPAAPTADQRARAVALEQRAAESEWVGDIRAARDLHRQAARLDASSEEIAYRLARADEALGDRREAVGQYCRFLALAPQAKNAAEVRSRLTALAAPARAAAPRPTRVVTSAGRRASGRQRLAYAAAPPAGRGSRRLEPRPAVAPATPSAAADTPSVASAVDEIERRGGASAGAGGRDTVSDDATAAATAPTPSEPASSAPRAPERVERHTGSGAVIGAAIGAAIGGISGHSARSAAIGGIAGGLLGAVAGHATVSRTPGFAN